MKAGLFVRTFKREFQQDRIGDIAAMLTYFALFSVFPMAIFAITVALLVVPEHALRDAAAMLERMMPAQLHGLVESQLLRMQRAAGRGIAVGTAALALWGASKGAVALGRALNDLCGKKETRPWWRVQLTGIAVTLGVTLLLTVALGLLVLGPLVTEWLKRVFGFGEPFDALWALARWAGAALLVMLIWGILYRFLPDTDAPFRVFTPGAATGIGLWVAVSLLFSLYVRSFANYEKTYGALAGMIVLLLWIWWSNFCMLLGAEINDTLRQIANQRARGQRA